MESLKKILAPYINQTMVLGVITIYAVTIIDRKLMEKFLANGSYFIILLLLVLWVASIIGLVHHFKPFWKPILRSYGPGLLFSLLMTVVIFSSVEPSLRVLSDESNIISVSHSMVSERKINNVTEGIWYYRGFHPLASGMPVRPLVFQFFIHIVHILTGYRAANAFVVNFIVLSTLFFIVFALFHRFGKTKTGIAAIILVAAQPITSLTGTSAGYELTAALFLILSFVALWTFLKNSSTPTFLFLWFTLLVAANIRYEGIIFLVVVMTLLAALKQLKFEYFKAYYGLIVWSTPIVLMPLVWQRLMPLGRIFQTKEVAYSMEYVLPHTLSFFKTIFKLNFYYPYAPVVCIAGMVGMMYFVYRVTYGQRRFQKYEYFLIGITSTCFMLAWFIYISYHFGRADHPSSARYFVLFTTVFSIMAAAFLSGLPLFKKSPSFLILVAVLCFIPYHTVAVKDVFSRTQTVPRRYHFTHNFFKHIAREDNNFVVIDNYPSQHVIHNWGGVHYSKVLSNDVLATQLEQHLINRLYLVQDISYQDKEPTNYKKINKVLRLETLKELQNRGESFIRISRAYFLPKEEDVSKEGGDKKEENEQNLAGLENDLTEPAVVPSADSS
jgi:hypothetical protein